MQVSWFSAGVSSAVATKMLIDSIDQVFYIHIDDQHPDTLRFVRDCEEWFGKPIVTMRSELGTVENACLMAGGKGYINGPAGAACTIRLKRRVRKGWERGQKDWLAYIWGLDVNETDRRDKLLEAMPDVDHRFPLIEERMTKTEAHRILTASGIKRPAMYDLGYQNNNCVGCIKGGAAYWNRILDELDPDAGRDKPPICGDCGIMCEIMAIE